MHFKKALYAAVVHPFLGFSAILPASSALAAEGGDTWDIALGAGVASFPKYAGGEARRVEPLPVISVRYRRFFIGAVPGAGTPAGLGVYLYENNHWQIGAALGGDVIKPRKESDDSRHLRGLGDINGTIRGGLFASYTLGWLTLRGNALYDLEDHHNHEGMLASLEAAARYSPLARLTLSAGPGLTFANRRYMQTFFGIDAIQSERSGYAEYLPQGGVALVNFSLGAQYHLTSHWNLAAHVSAQRLQGDAARSVIVENKNQNIYALFAVYGF